MSADAFGANTPGMKHGVIDLTVGVGGPLQTHGKLINHALASYPNIGGNGQFGKAFAESYDPAAKASKDFIFGLKDLLDLHGGTTEDLADLFDNVNDTATDEVSGLDPNVSGPVGPTGPTHVV